jgi:hypothetical protein
MGGSGIGRGLPGADPDLGGALRCTLRSRLAYARAQELARTDAELAVQLDTEADRALTMRRPADRYAP